MVQLSGTGGPFKPDVGLSGVVATATVSVTPLKTLPSTEFALVLRTDFSDENAWELVTALMQRPHGDFKAYVTLLSSPEFEGVTIEQLSDLNHTSQRRFLFVVDSICLRHSEHPVLAVDLSTSPVCSFRVIPSELWGVENNLSTANMDFSEFHRAVDKDGIFRGFR